METIEILILLTGCLGTLFIFRGFKFYNYRNRLPFSAYIMPIGGIFLIFIRRKDEINAWKSVKTGLLLYLLTFFTFIIYGYNSL